MYTVLAYQTVPYNTKTSETKEFKELSKLAKWCREYLSQPNRCCVVHSTYKSFRWGMHRDRPCSQVRKIGVFRDPSQLPKW